MVCTSLYTDVSHGLVLCLALNKHLINIWWLNDEPRTNTCLEQCIIWSKPVLAFVHLIWFRAPWIIIFLASGGSFLEHYPHPNPRPGHHECSQLSSNLKLPPSSPWAKVLIELFYRFTRIFKPHVCPYSAGGPFSWSCTGFQTIAFQADTAHGGDVARSCWGANVQASSPFCSSGYHHYRYFTISTKGRN